MKLSRIFLLTIVLGTSSIALADSGGDITFARMEENRQRAMQAWAAESTATSVVEARPYTYGMDLDIAELISLRPLSDVCGVIPMEMRYRDSQGAEQAIRYQTERVPCRSTR